MAILAASICKIGGREYNQDFVAHHIEDGKACFIVCDGLGAYVGSEVASMLCANKVIGNFKATVESGGDITAEETALTITEAAHHHVVEYKYENSKISSSCTTMSLVMTDLNAAVMSHIGDTRIYFFADGQLKYQTRDHSLAQLAVDMGKITTREIRTHKDQNKLTRVLGSDYYVEPDINRMPGPLMPGDAFILCTDGFWEYVYEDEMEEALKECKTPEEVIDRLEKLLIERHPPYNDNYTALVAMVVEE